MEITNSKLSNYVLYSNKNLEKLARQLINESTNAVLLETYNDKFLMADHDSGSIYLADYNFDGKVLTMENFEPVFVSKENSRLAEAVSNYFESDGYDTAEIVEAFLEDSEMNNNDLNESIVEALASKKVTDKINYSELAGINEDVRDVAEMQFFKNYQERLEESPTNSIKFIDWNNPVRVAIIDEDYDNTIALGANAKAKILSKNRETRNTFAEAAEEMMNGNSFLMEDFLEENSSILALNESEFREFVGMSIIGNKELTSNRKAVIETVNNIVNENEHLVDLKNLFEEAGDDAEPSESDAKLETSDADITALKGALDKALEKISDEKLVSKIEALKDALDSAKDSGTTDVGTVKECVELLSF